MTHGERLHALISEALKGLGAGGLAFTVEPAELQHGDYASNAALAAAKALERSPREVADALASAIQAAGDPSVSGVSVAGPGFLNFTLSDEALRASPERPGRSERLKGKKVVVEYTDPNPFKEFHIGHLMSNAIGESLSRLVESQGAETHRACYQGDVGMHVACALWGKRKDPQLTWGKAYALGAGTYKDGIDEEKKEIVALNKTIYERTDVTVNGLYDEGKEASLAYFEKIYQKLGTHFDHYFFESKTGVFGKEIVEKNTPGIFERSDSAIVYKGDESKGLHTRVFINKEGLPTYEAKELGLAKIKYDWFPYDRSIVVTANEINDYFRVLLDAMGKVFPDLAAKTEHIGHGMMRLPSGKMSSRTGDIVTAESMIADVKEKVRERMKESPVPEGERDSVAEKVAIGSIKYSILRQSPGKDIVFDLESATSFEGDSGAYLQYAHARACSILRKGKDIAPDAATMPVGDPPRLLARFGDIAARAEADRAPQYVATYLIEVAHAFNRFYGETLVLDEKDPVGTAGRLALVLATKRTLAEGLWMLGIHAPEVM